jgi:hypothetical protein
MGNGMNEKYEYEEVTDPELLAQLNQGRETGSNKKENSSLGRSYKDYLQGYGTQLAQSAAKGGYHLGMAPSYGYEALTGHPLYSLVKPDISDYIPESEAGQTGKHVGETVADLATMMAPGRLGLRGLSALLRYHPLTKGQMGRQFQGPINAAEEAGVNARLSPRDIYELDQLLSHPALEARGAAGKALTPMGRASLIEGASRGEVPSLHSAQSRLGDLERVIPKQGESILASTRVRPLKERILEAIEQGMQEEGLGEEAQQYRNARQGARRHYRTRKAIGKTAKTLSGAALIKLGLSGLKSLP